MKANGINTGLSDEVKTMSTMVQPEITLSIPQQVFKQEPSPKQSQFSEQFSSPIPQTTLNFVDLIDENGPVVSDALLSSHSLSKMDEETMDLDFEQFTTQ